MIRKQQFSSKIKRQTLAEQVAAAVEDAILAGEWAGGDPLPTEPELSEQFNVSRAVIRDATRMLAAKGLVDVQHGRGVFVTESQSKAFGEALLLALRRAGATAWDVEHFEQIIYPEVFALASEAATEDEIERLRQHIDEYLQIMKRVLFVNPDDNVLLADAAAEATESYRMLIAHVFSMTHNKVFELLAPPLVRLRSFRNWQDDDMDKDELLAMESEYFQTIINAIVSRDPEKVRQMMHRLMKLPPEAVQAMRTTPVGEVPIIPIPLQHRITKKP
jgi:GntR family transcriptional repressor for pyruvate dehydrogenase complex